MNLKDEMRRGKKEDVTKDTFLDTMQNKTLIVPLVKKLVRLLFKYSQYNWNLFLPPGETHSPGLITGM